MDGFPILGTCPREYIPMKCIQPHELQALKNHGGQNLEKLASRGGLDWTEILAVLEDRPWKSMNKLKAREKVLQLCKET